MPRARYTADGGLYRIGRLDFEPGDEHEVDRETAEHLSDHDDFVVTVEKDTAEKSDAGDDEGETDSDEQADQDDETDDFDVDAFLDRTPVDDVVEDIEAGEVDDHLDAVAEAAGRVTVEDAIGQRRAELEG